MRTFNKEPSNFVILFLDIMFVQIIFTIFKPVDSNSKSLKLVFSHVFVLVSSPSIFLIGLPQKQKETGHSTQFEKHRKPCSQL